MSKGRIWSLIGSIITAIGSAIAVLLFQKRMNQQATPEPLTTDPEKLTKDIQDIKAKSDEEIIEEHTTPEQKERKDDVVQNQVSKAMKDAERFRRRKKD